MNKSKNRIAFEEGRITKDAFIRMAVYKVIAHDNGEDLDINEDYSSYGLIKCQPRVEIEPERKRKASIIKELNNRIGGYVELCEIEDAVEDWWENCRDYSDTISLLLPTWYWTDETVWSINGFLQECLEEEKVIKGYFTVSDYELAD